MTGPSERLPRGAPHGRAQALPIDPRIQRRGIERRREEGRKRLFILLGCVAILLLGAGTYGLGRSPLLNVGTIDIRGVGHTSRDEVVRSANLAGHPAMVDVGTAEVERRVERLPWVKTARARRRWPRTIQIDITEREPAAAAPVTAGGWALVDALGRILEVDQTKPSGLPVLGNVTVAEPVGASIRNEAIPALSVAAALPGAIRERIADVATVAAGSVELQLVAPGGIVRLGPPIDLKTKLTVLATVLARVDLAGVSVIDVRVPSAPALTRR